MDRHVAYLAANDAMKDIDAMLAERDVYARYQAYGVLLFTILHRDPHALWDAITFCTSEGRRLVPDPEPSTPSHAGGEPDSPESVEAVCGECGRRSCGPCVLHEVD